MTIETRVDKGCGFRGGVRRETVPLSLRSSVLVDEPSGSVCVVFLLLEERAPERAPRMLRFRPPWRD